VAKVLGRIRLTTDDADIQGVDLVIEAIVEDLGVKYKVTAALAGGVTPDGIWASNTSALPIGELAPAFPDPTRFIGLHFFSPVEDMQLVEVVRGPQTSPETLARSLAFVGKIGKTPVVVNDGYGFYTTRVFMRFLLESVQILAEGHDPAVLEHGARVAGMVVPPLQIFDEVGLMLGRHVGDEWERRNGATMPEAAALLKAMTDELGRHGRAKGAGFYDYESGRRKGLWSGLSRWRRADVESNAEALGRRLLLVQAAETARTLEEGLVPRPPDADVAAVLGIGFPAATGGPVSWLDRQGLASVVDELDGLADWLGERFRPTAAMRAHATARTRLRGVP
jgi:3-hydroxyacyl-CoA dehydrogenase/enoyl-CoA hydratase/3-hydroxybutyryl-CoA epimerase